MCNEIESAELFGLFDEQLPELYKDCEFTEQIKLDEHVVVRFGTRFGKPIMIVEHPSGHNAVWADCR